MSIKITGSSVDLGATGSIKIGDNHLTEASIGGRRNLIINGDMVVAQRDKGDVTYDVTNLTDFPLNSFALHDRWGTHRHTTGTATSGRWTCSRPYENGKYWFKQTVEQGFTPGTSYVARTSVYLQSGEDWKKFGMAGKTVTYSFDFKANRAGQYSFAIGSPNDKRFSIFSWQYDNVGAEQRVIKTFTIPQEWDDMVTEIGTRDKGLEIYMCYGVNDGHDLEGTTYLEGLFPPTDDGTALTHPDDIKFWEMSGSTVQWTNVQLEFGDKATPFEKRFYGEELALCQMHYNRVLLDNAHFVTTSEGYAGINLSVPYMIKPPTFSFYQADGTQTTGFGLSGGPTVYPEDFQQVNVSDAPSNSPWKEPFANQRFITVRVLATGNENEVHRNTGPLVIEMSAEY